MHHADVLGASGLCRLQKSATGGVLTIIIIILIVVMAPIMVTEAQQEMYSSYLTHLDAFPTTQANMTGQ